MNVEPLSWLRVYAPGEVEPGVYVHAAELAGILSRAIEHDESGDAIGFVSDLSRQLVALSHSPPQPSPA